jgi:hypothetical protein
MKFMDQVLPMRQAISVCFLEGLACPLYLAIHVFDLARLSLNLVIGIYTKKGI